MVTTTNSTNPLALFDQMWTHASDLPLTKWGSINYPRYNVVQSPDKSKAKIVFAVAGFSKEDINVQHLRVDNLLVVKGMHSKDVGDSEWSELHRGISAQNFELKFRIHPNTRVKSCKLTDGLLTITLVQEVPKEQQPLTIAIK